LLQCLCIRKRHSKSSLGPFHEATTGDVMAISKELLDILVCPVCKTPVKMLPDETGLKCSTCRRVYPVRDDIPVMMPEEASVAKE
jgi:uncharacterized protein